MPRLFEIPKLLALLQDQSWHYSTLVNNETDLITRGVSQGYGKCVGIHALFVPLFSRMTNPAGKSGIASCCHHLAKIFDNDSCLSTCPIELNTVCATSSSKNSKKRCNVGSPKTGVSTEDAFSAYVPTDESKIDSRLRFYFCNKGVPIHRPFPHSNCTLFGCTPFPLLALKNV